ncbi:MAG: peptidoglycan DD-metalloendopeptidase family protein [Thermodesulfovibrionales bacterium]
MKVIQDITNYYPRNIEEYRGRNDPGAVKAVAKEMEALFVYELIKAMRETANINKEDGLGKDVYQGMFDMELARLLSERGLGLQDLLLREFKDFLNQKNGIKDGRNTDNKELTGKSESIVKSTDSESVQQSLPVNGVVSSNFGIRRHPIYGDYRFHSGVDIAADVGTNIYPFRGGKVIFSGEQKGYGNIIIIDHGNGLISKYAHNLVNLVKEGDEVGINTVIAQVGYSGNSTGPHLHFEIIDRGKVVNPERFLAKG